MLLVAYAVALGVPEVFSAEDPCLERSLNVVHNVEDAFDVDDAMAD
jgi:hypothetical protein